MCSDLVTVRWKNKNRREMKYPALLEEIFPSGGCVQVENPIPVGSWIDLRCRTASFSGVVAYCRYEQDLGYFVGIEFELGQEWSLEKFRPRYYVDPLELCPNQSLSSDLASGKLAWCDASECNREICPREIVTLAIDPRVRLRNTVREVAAEVAKLCGSVEEEDLKRCFSRLFQIGPDCLLWREFAREYQAARASLNQREDLKPNPLARIQSIARLLAAIPREALGSSENPST